MIVQHHTVRGFDVAVRREDLRVGEPFVPHGKTPSLCNLMRALALEKTQGVSCFASRGSDWALNAAIAASTVQLPLTIYCQQPSKKTALPAFIERARDEYGATIDHVRVNHTLIMSALARIKAVERGDFFIPFGLATPLVMDELTERLRGIEKTATIVLCAGSGITLVCLLKSLLHDQNPVKCVVAVSSGRSEHAIKSTVDRHVGELNVERATGRLEIVRPFGAYGETNTIESPWPTHAFYERKAYKWLDENISQLEQPITFLNM